MVSRLKASHWDASIQVPTFPGLEQMPFDHQIRGMRWKDTGWLGTGFLMVECGK